MNKLLTVFIFSLLGLILIGVLALYSATGRFEHPDRFYWHLSWLAMGVTGAAICASFRYSILQKWHLPTLLLLLVIILLTLVLVPAISEEVNGAHRWFRGGGQPSELAKLLVVIALADYSARHLAVMHQFKRGFLVPVSGAVLVAGLVFVEQDWGTALLIAAVSLALIYVGGTRVWYILGSVLAACLLLYVLIQFHPERLKRLPVFVEQLPGNHRDVWQVWNSILSFAAGGVWGTAPGLGSHKYGYVAEQETDFILSLIGEELGFVGVTVVIVLFLSLILSGVMIAWRIKDPFGQYLVLGIIFTIGLQAFINIGVVTSTLPNKGLPLPFISYGGSNLVCLLAGAGLIISTARFAPLAATDSLPLLARAASSDTSPTITQPSVPQPDSQPGPSRRRLLRICYGPNWPQLIAVRHAYQMPPKNQTEVLPGRIQRWLRRFCVPMSLSKSPGLPGHKGPLL